MVFAIVLAVGGQRELGMVCGEVGVLEWFCFGGVGVTWRVTVGGGKGGWVVGFGAEKKQG